MSTILFVVTGADHWTLRDGEQYPTGYWADELLDPFEVFTRAGYDVAFATPGGVTPVPDDRSLVSDGGGDKLQARLDAIKGLHDPLPLADVDLDDYVAVFYPGGHGPMQDLAVNATSGELLTTALASDKPLGIVCHGPAAILATEGERGSSPFSGRTLTGFSNAEERAGGLADRAKWLLEDRLRALGADVQVGEPFAPNVLVDDNLITGQNPASAEPLAQELVKQLEG